jgi:TolB protein
VLQLTFGDRGLLSLEPDWSADGRRLAFTRQPSTGLDSWIYLMGADGRLTRLARGRSPAWSPDGRGILFSVHRDGKWGIWIVDPDTGEQSRVRQSEYEYFGDVAWSPDGRTIAFTSDEGYYETHILLWTVNHDGSNARRLVAPEPRANTTYSKPSWSPDGRAIAVLFSAWFSLAEQINDLVLLNPDGSGRRQIAGFGAGLSPGSLTWSPDGRMIAIGVHDGSTGQSSLKYIRVDGTGTGHILDNGSSPDWRPRP